jgi:hypothetical protein
MTKAEGKYEWINVDHLISKKIPREMKEIIDAAFKRWQRRNRAS